MSFRMRLPFVQVLILSLSAVLLASPQETADQERQRALEQQRQEEVNDYYEKWLNEDVVYIITDEEKAVFASLVTPEEKEQFIEQFWRRRDSDLKTATNEFKEEHYRRIAYANENFVSGQAGWRTDRGRIYIIHGPPDEIENHAGGGRYNRPMEEGGGTTSTYAFVKWRYRHIEGIGDDIELEFVDKTFTEEFRLAQTPFEKDLLLQFPGTGFTLAEEIGLADRAHHPALNPGNYQYRERYPLMEARYGDTPFARYERYERVQAPPTLKYKELKELVDVNISFENLPIRVRQDYFRLNDQEFLVPITLEFSNSELSYEELDGVHTASVAIYGLVTSIKNEVVQEFEDDVMSSFVTGNREMSLRRTSMYQKIVILDRKVRYKLDLVVKDLRSGKTGVVQQAIIPPAHNSDELWASSVVLSNVIQSMPDVPDQDEMFVLGDVRVLPVVSNLFSRTKPLNLYLQVYGAQLDQTTFEPSLQIKYQVLKGNESIAEFVDTQGQTIQFFSPRRVVLIAGIPIQDLEPGKYKVLVEVKDLIDDRVISAEEVFGLDEMVLVAENR